MSLIKILIRLAFRQEGKPYIWGKQSPLEGFDCSGLIVFLFCSIGVIPWGKDLSADGLYKRFSKVVDTTIPFLAEEGDLVFFLNSSGKATHVELCVGNELMLGASGGGRNTINALAAKRDNAFVKCRPISAREGAVILKTSCLI